jgi:hypothetical protein
MTARIGRNRTRPTGSSRGHETIYIFTVGQGTGFERIASCEVAIDPNHPLFLAVQAAMASVAR